MAGPFKYIPSPCIPPCRQCTHLPPPHLLQALQFSGLSAPLQPHQSQSHHPAPPPVSGLHGGVLSCFGLMRPITKAPQSPRAKYFTSEAISHLYNKFVSFFIHLSLLIEMLLFLFQVDIRVKMEKWMHVNHLFYDNVQKLSDAGPWFAR